MQQWMLCSLQSPYLYCWTQKVLKLQDVEVSNDTKYAEFHKNWPTSANNNDNL
jgi:hypothetical protein